MFFQVFYRAKARICSSTALVLRGIVFVSMVTIRFTPRIIPERIISPRLDQFVIAVFHKTRRPHLHQHLDGIKLVDGGFQDRLIVVTLGQSHGCVDPSGVQILAGAIGGVRAIVVPRFALDNDSAKGAFGRIGQGLAALADLVHSLKYLL